MGISGGVLVRSIDDVRVVTDSAAVEASAGFVLGVGFGDDLVHLDHRVDALCHGQLWHGRSG